MSMEIHGNLRSRFQRLYKYVKNKKWKDHELQSLVFVAFTDFELLKNFRVAGKNDPLSQA